jgi:hypothetical protein
LREPLNRGRTWWAHVEFTRVNIAPPILRKKIEDLREVSPCRNIASAFLRSACPAETVLLQQWIFSRHAVDDDVEAVVGAEDPDRGANRGLDQRRGLRRPRGPRPVSGV